MPDSPRPSPEARLVSDPGSFDALLAELDASPGLDVALDTEADSFHHYFEKVCLLQLSWDGTARLVDPLRSLAIGDILARLALGQDALEPLWKGLRLGRGQVLHSHIVGM